MDPARFERDLHALFDDFPSSERPRGQRFDHVLERVPGLARENNLALLNLAASLLDAGESYVEVGTYRGTSLIAAMLGNESGDFVGIDDFSMGTGSRDELERNLAAFDLAGRATILEGDAFALIPTGSLGERRVGAYYYDAAHSYEAHLRGLVMIEPFLAPRALLIVDDSDWEQVQDATRDYLAQQPKARMLIWIPGKDNGLPAWWEGVQVLAWEDESRTPVTETEAVAVAAPEVELIETL
jgi:predicted O-methyltransferase YrrM